MCGIAGAYLTDCPRAAQAVRVINRAQSHRGPDDEGLEIINVPGGYLVFGHRRLSILDLSPAGRQPMQNPKTGDWIVFNGEIYNYPQLSRELEQAGTVFRSHSDTEVILHAFARWGLDCFDRLHGMFALALYDESRRRLVLARDPVGIKPLYYSSTGEGLVFASELRAIEASGLVSCEIDHRALAGLLAYGAVPGPLTMFRQVNLLEPGTWLTLDLTIGPAALTDLKPVRCWDFPRPLASPIREQAILKVRNLLEVAARSHLLSDVPVGIFLSSGLDSSAIAALCAEPSRDPMHTFTVSFAEKPEMDENPVAEETARLLGARHHSIQLNETQMRDQVQRYLAHLDQPTMDGLNTYIIAGAVRDCGIKVALSGLGGDELFGGYPTFREVPQLARLAKLAQLIPERVRGKMVKWLCRGKSKAQYQKALEMAMAGPALRTLYFRRRRLFSDREMRAFGFRAEDLNLSENFLPRETETDRATEIYDPPAAVGVLESRFYMGNVLLRDADVFGMAHGLEIRVPFLDRGLLDYVPALPGQWRVARHGNKKPLLAEALGTKIRSRLRNLKKRGFVLPQADWMAGPLREKFEHLLRSVKDSGCLNPDGVSMVWQDFLADLRGPTWSRAWMLGVLGAWLKRSANL